MPTPGPRAIAAALRRPRNLALLGVFVLCIGVRAALPEVLRRVIVSQADAALVGRIELDDVDLSLLFGGATLEGLRVYTDELPASPASGPPGPPASPSSPTGTPPPPPAEAKAPLFSANRLAVDLSWLGLVRKTVRIQGVELEGFAVRLDRAADGVLVLPAPVPKDAPAEPVEPKTNPGTPWKVQLDALALRDGQIGFRDFAVGEKPAQFEIGVGSLEAKDLALVIDATGSKPGEIHLTAKIGGGTLGLDAVYAMKAAGPAVDAHIKLADFPIGGARVYLPDLGWSDLQGDLSAELHHIFELGGAHTLSGRITLANVGATVSGIEKAPLAWKRLDVEIGNVDVVGRNAVVSKVTLDGPYVLLDPLGQTPVPALRLASKTPEVTAPAPAAPSPASPAFVWKVEEIVITGGRIDLLGGPQTLELGLGAKVSGLSSDLAKPATLAVEVSEGSGSIHLDGAFTAQPPGFDGGIKLAELALGRMAAPFAPGIAALLRSGVARADLKVAAGPPASPKAPQAGGARVSGSLAVTALEVQAGDGKDFRLAWKELAIDARELTVPGVLAAPDAPKSTAPIRVTLDRFKLVEPAVRLTRTETGISLPDTTTRAADGETAATAGPAPAPDAGASPPAPAGAAADPVIAEIAKFDLERGRIEVTDRTVKPFYQANVSPLDLHATGVRWPGPVAKQLKLTAKTREGGLFSVAGHLDPKGSALDAKLEKFPLAPFNPYATSTGYSLSEGALLLESKIKFAGTRYDVENHIVIHELDVAGAQGDALFLQQFGVPLELALALLTDVSGDIVLDVPVTQDESGTTLGLGTIVGGALARALVNAIASPLKLLNAVAGAGGKVDATPQAVAFQPGRTELAPGAPELVDQLAGLLARSPGLGIGLRGSAGPDDTRWLREQALRTELEGGGGIGGALRGLTTERGERKAVLAALQARAKGEPGDVPTEYTAWFEEKVAAQSLPSGALEKLAAARGEMLRDDLVREHGVDAERVTVEAPAADAGGEGRPEVALALAAARRSAPAEAASSPSNLPEGAP